MKNRLVIWGTRDEEDKVLILLDLQEDKDNVELTLLPHKEVPEELYQSLMSDWRKGKEVELPENKEKKELPLNLGEDLLPENIRTKQTDLIQRTQAEWQFYVASHKMYMLYKEEAEDYKEKIEELDTFKPRIWEELKSFWDKVQKQIKDRNLFGFHIDDLRKRTDSLFDEMKKLRKKREERLKEDSEPIFKKYQEILDEVEAKVEKGLSLKPIFEELKRIQRDFKKEKLYRGYQNKLWNRIDGLFKVVKKKRFGDKDSGGGKVGRLKRRLAGLEKVVKNMQSSIEHEKKNLHYENKRKQHSTGELEEQLREAKLKMIKERLNSKESKLKDILETQRSVQSQYDKAKSEEEKKELEKKKKEAAKAAKEKIKKEIEENQKNFEESEMKRAMGMLDTDEESSKDEDSDSDKDVEEISVAAASISKLTSEEE